jgi:general secretion pathway protein B
MSSILKALEKVEDAQNARRQGGVNGLSRKRERRPAWILPAWVFSAAVVAALSTYAAMGGFSRSARPALPAVSAAPQVQTVVIEPEQIVPEQNVNKAKTKPAKAKPVKAKPAVAIAAKPTRVPAVAVPHRHVAAPALARVAPVHAAKDPVAAPVTAHVAPAKSRQEIRVTGIAWQKDSASSAAIVNGHSVQQGGMVGGYKVEQIFEDKVRFSDSTGKQDISLGAGE